MKHLQPVLSMDKISGFIPGHVTSYFFSGIRTLGLAVMR